MRNDNVNVAVIGFGRMGEMFLNQMLKSNMRPDAVKWNVLYICDPNENARTIAGILSPSSTIVEDDDIIFGDPKVDVVVLTALSDSRVIYIKKAIATGKHIITEKPLADTIENEWEVAKLLSNAPILSTVNLSLRNAWYNKEMKRFIESGEIGDLAIIRICHMTPGLAPGEGHAPEGPCFHDCGMHYVDFARWYAGSEYKSWNAQAMDFWDYGEPWWLQCHGTFENGVVFDITQGHVYGQLAKDLTHISYNDIIGTKGIARMYHDFHTAVLDMHGVSKTVKIEKPFGDKNLDVLLDLFSESISKGELHPDLPTIKDAVIASEYAWRFLDDANKNDLPTKGDKATLKQIIKRRSKLDEGYGLLRRPGRKED